MNISGDKDPESNHELGRNDMKHTKTDHIEIGYTTGGRKETPRVVITHVPTPNNRTRGLQGAHVAKLPIGDGTWTPYTHTAHPIQHPKENT